MSKDPRTGGRLPGVSAGPVLHALGPRSIYIGWRSGHPRGVRDMGENVLRNTAIAGLILLAGGRSSGPRELLLVEGSVWTLDGAPPFLSPLSFPTGPPIRLKPSLDPASSFQVLFFSYMDTSQSFPASQTGGVPGLISPHPGG